MPEEQHGFTAGRSTMTACRILQDYVDLSVSERDLAVHAVFVDLRSAFDTAPRGIVLRKLADFGVPGGLLRLLGAILDANQITLDDGVVEHEPFLQTTGYPQGDNLSPLLFSVLLSDLPAKIRVHDVEILMYADDIVIMSRIRTDVQKALKTLEDYCSENHLVINAEKTKALKFRRGISMPASDRLRLCGQALEYVNSFVYLGVEFSFKPGNFARHIANRARKGQVALSCIKHPQKLSVKTALALFDIKVASVASYGIQIVWEHLSVAQLWTLEKLKPSFLKRTMGLSLYTRNRLCYLLADTGSLIETVKNRFKLHPTPAFEIFVDEFKEKLVDVPLQFYVSFGMSQDGWKEPLCPNRHVITRASVHGFHHLFCSRHEFHEADSRCRCRLCGRMCHMYHSMECESGTSLTEMASGAWRP